jgi:hypothetical protein
MKALSVSGSGYYVGKNWANCERNLRVFQRITYWVFAGYFIELPSHQFPSLPNHQFPSLPSDCPPGILVGSFRTILHKLLSKSSQFAHWVKLSGL